jgi:competence protein ComEA
MAGPPLAVANSPARSLLIVAVLGACLGAAALEGRAHEAVSPPRCAPRVEVVSGSFDQLGCADVLSALLARAGRSSGCGSGAGLLAGLRDGDRVEVLDGCTLGRGRMSGPALRLLGLPIDVNRASVEDLEALPGLGPVMAARIAAARPFRTLAELREVSGIGPLRFAALREAAEVSEVTEQDLGRR